MKIQESGENYLEAILTLQQRIGQVRSIDVVQEMNFSKPSVSIAMKRLREGGYIFMNEDGYITLSPSGREIAERIYERHCLIAEFLMALGVDQQTAFDDACRMEHVISEESFQHMKEHFRQHTQL